MLESGFFITSIFTNMYCPVGCRCCWLQGKKAWDPTRVESPNSCNNWGLLGQVSADTSAILCCVLTYSAIDFIDIYLMYCSEPWKRPSFASIMDSLRSLLKPPTPQPGLPNMPCLTWMVGTPSCSSCTYTGFYWFWCLTGLHRFSSHRYAPNFIRSCQY